MANAIMTESSFGSGGLNSIMTYYADQFIAAGRSRVRPLNFCKSVGTGDFATKGDTVRVGLAPTIASNLLTDGNAVTLDDTAGTSVSVSLNKHRYTSFGETIVAKSKANGTPTDSLEMSARMTGLFNDIEADVLTIGATSFTTNIVGSYNSAITEANVVAGVGKLFDAKVPQDAPLMGFVHQSANAWQALAQIASFANAYQRGGQAASPVLATSVGYGSSVPYHGVEWNMSQSITKSGTSVDNLVFHPDAICVAFRSLPLPEVSGVEAANFVDSDSRIAFQVVRSWNKDRLAVEYTIHTLYGYSVGRESWGLLYKS